jgi:Putative phage serine protease XkdF
MTLLSFLSSLRKEGPTPGDVHLPTALGSKKPKKKKPADTEDDVDAHLPVTNMTLAAQQITGQANPTAKFAEVLKVDESLGLVLGWAIVCKKDGADYWDLQEDHIPESSMLSAAVDFMQNSRVAKEMHAREARGDVVFAFPLTQDIAKAFGIESTITGLMIAIKPHDDAMLAKFKDGTYTGFSIGGSRLKDEEVAP